MPQGDKRAYTAKQIRRARDIEQSYEDRGVSEKESERRAWATVNKQDAGGLKARPSARGAATKAAPGGVPGASATRRSAGNSARKSATTRARRAS